MKNKFIELINKVPNRTDNGKASPKVDLITRTDAILMFLQASGEDAEQLPYAVLEGEIKGSSYNTIKNRHAKIKNLKELIFDAYTDPVYPQKETQGFEFILGYEICELDVEAKVYETRGKIEITKIYIHFEDGSKILNPDIPDGIDEDVSSFYY